jgi:hypothetical protein
MPDRTARAGRLLRYSAGALAALVLLLVVLIAARVFDPQPFGPLAQTDQPGRRELSGAGEATFPQPAPWPPAAPPERFSLRLSAAHAGGETDSGYGLALVGDGARLVVAVSPLGYVTINEEAAGQQVDHVPWQTWPHARPGSEANELWLDVIRQGDGARVTAWINRERLWQGMVEWSPGGIGFWLESFGGPVAVDFRRLEWFAAAYP